MVIFNNLKLIPKIKIINYIKYSLEMEISMKDKPKIIKYMHEQQIINLKMEHFIKVQFIKINSLGIVR